MSSQNTGTRCKHLRQSNQKKKNCNKRPFQRNRVVRFKQHSGGVGLSGNGLSLSQLPLLLASLSTLTFRRLLQLLQSVVLAGRGVIVHPFRPYCWGGVPKRGFTFEEECLHSRAEELWRGKTPAKIESNSGEWSIITGVTLRSSRGCPILPTLYAESVAVRPMSLHSGLQK